MQSLMFTHDCEIITTFSVTVFFTLTLVTLWRYSREIDFQQMSHDSKSTGRWKCRLHDSHDLKTDKDGVLKPNPDLIQPPTGDLGASSGVDFVNQTVEHDPFHMPVVDHYVTATHSQEHGSQRQPQRDGQSRDVYETLEPFQPQIPTDGGHTSNGRSGLLARIARYVFRRPTNS